MRKIKEYEQNNNFSNIFAISNDGFWARNVCEVVSKKQEKDRSKVSCLFSELISENEIVQTEDSVANNMKYKRLKE